MTDWQEHAACKGTHTSHFYTEYPRYARHVHEGRCAAEPCARIRELIGESGQDIPAV